ncbi:pyruvate kinase [Anaerolentibacter hominis]|uniref:pyruvate kinase n=1 Tax=Anaerolentibacter hominis TaxID=3079009 RepID=UPI0031B84A02
MRKTKIICTLGPATQSDKVLRALCLEGMDVARFNFSHGDYMQHEENLKRIRRMGSELKLPIAALLDTRGPEIRIGTFKNGSVTLKTGQLFTLTAGDIEGNESAVSISYKNLPMDVRPGDRLLLDDGLVELNVLSVNGPDIVCKVHNGGQISDRKGVNAPGVGLTMPFISEKDYKDIVFGIEHGFDFIAASFTRSAEDILEIRKILSEYHCNKINLIAKIENMQGVRNIDEIIKVSDGIMIARGDMGVEIPLEEVPVIQKKIIHKVYNAEKQVITATQMLDSMMKNPRPTRAEATDVANAIYDGTSAIMLSGETAAGLYPVEALRTMVRIAMRTEHDINYKNRFKMRDDLENPDITNAIAHATCTTAIDLNASAIITVTKSGKTARLISKYRPDCRIIGCSTEPYICRHINLSWGVTPLLIQEETKVDELFEHVVDTAERAGLVKKGEVVVLTAGAPLGISGTTNMIKVHVVGHILLEGAGLIDKTVCEPLRVCRSEEECKKAFRPGEILVIPETSNNIMEQMKQASAIIVETGGSNCHAAIVGYSRDIPVVLEARHATRILKTGTVVTVEGKTGRVTSEGSLPGNK